MKVIATTAFQELGKNVKELHRIPVPGEVFDVTEDRYNFLAGNNQFNRVFVIKAEAQPEVKEEVITEESPEIVVIEPETEEEVKPKRTRKPKAETENEG